MRVHVDGLDACCCHHAREAAIDDCGEVRPTLAESAPHTWQGRADVGVVLESWGQDLDGRLLGHRRESGPWEQNKGTAEQAAGALELWRWPVVMRSPFRVSARPAPIFTLLIRLLLPWSSS